MRAHPRAGSASAGVVCGLSGGVDSTVTAALIHRAIGDQLTCIFVDNGVLRRDEAKRVMAVPRRRLPLPHQGGRRRGAVPRAPGGRRRPGEEAADHRRHLHRGLRGGGAARCATSSSSPRARSIRTSSSRCRSRGRRRPSRATTTSAACPSACTSKLVEPLRELFKDEVRELGAVLGIPAAIVGRQPVPGPGPGDPHHRRGRRRARRRSCRPPTPSCEEEIRAAGLYDARLAGLRRAAAGEDGRRHGRRAHLRERHRDPRRRDPSTA